MYNSYSLLYIVVLFLFSSIFSIENLGKDECLRGIVRRGKPHARANRFFCGDTRGSGARNGGRRLGSHCRWWVIGAFMRCGLPGNRRFFFYLRKNIGRSLRWQRLGLLAASRHLPEEYRSNDRDEYDDLDISHFVLSPSAKDGQI